MAGVRRRRSQRAPRAADPVLHAAAQLDALLAGLRAHGVQGSRQALAARLRGRRRLNHDQAALLLRKVGELDVHALVAGGEAEKEVELPALRPARADHFPVEAGELLDCGARRDLLEEVAAQDAL